MLFLQKYALRGRNRNAGLAGPAFLTLEADQLFALCSVDFSSLSFLCGSWFSVEASLSASNALMIPPDLLMEERSTISSSEPGFLTFTGGATAERSIQYLTC